jgi:hypothetical protein
VEGNNLGLILSVSGIRLEGLRKTTSSLEDFFFISEQEISQIRSGSAASGLLVLGHLCLEGLNPGPRTYGAKAPAARPSNLSPCFMAKSQNSYVFV